MGDKLYADTATKKLVMTEPPDVNGLVSLNVQEEMWSDLVLDWQDNLGLRKHTFPLIAIGGETVSAGKLGTTYVLRDPWQIDPNLDQDVTVGVDADTNHNIYGGTGTEEMSAQAGAMPFRGEIEVVNLAVHKVGTPSDSLHVGVFDALGGSLLQEGSIDGDLIPASHGSTQVPVHFDDPVTLPDLTTFYIVINRTGSRDTSNYYVIHGDTDDPFAGGDMWHRASGSWVEDVGTDIVMTVEVNVPYQLQVSGNIYTEDETVPVSIPTRNVNAVFVVSTLVERVETGTSGLTPAESQALIDIDTNVDTLITATAALSAKIDTLIASQDLTNEQLEAEHSTDPVNGLVILRNTTTLRRWEADAYEDYPPTQRYRGEGLEHIGQLVEVAWS